MVTRGQLSAERFEVADSFEEVNQLLYDRRMTDGLPVVPPTEERVRAMLAAVDTDPATELGVMPPRFAPTTVEAIAINSVMAGCLPSYLPVVIAAVEALLETRFNLYGIQATTHLVGPMLIVNGPIAKALDIQSGQGCLGPCWRANATIGRAIRLILLNIGGGLPSVGDMATHGMPGKYSFCFAENEEGSPWEPLHVERGFPKGSSTVTVIPAGGVHNMADLASKEAQGLLASLTLGMSALTSNLGDGGEPLCILCPEHAAILAREGFSKEEVKRYLFDKATVPLSRMPSEVVQRHLRRSPTTTPESIALRIAERPEDIILVVAGGVGLHSVFVPSWGAESLSVTRAISYKGG